MNEHGVLLSPITVNEKLQIIDGQNRFEALKQLHLPITFYIAEGYGIEEVKALNCTSRNWNPADLLHSLAVQGDEKAQQIEDIAKKYEGAFSITLISVAGCGNHLTKYKVNSGQISNNFDYKVCETVLNLCQEFMQNDFQRLGIAKDREFVRALRCMVINNNFDSSKMVDKIRKYYSNIYRCRTSEQYFQMLTDLYNFQSRAKQTFIYGIVK